MNKKLLFPAFFIGIGVSFYFPKTAFGENIGDIDAKHTYMTPRRCGLDSLYLACRWLLPDILKDEYHSLARLFPDVEKEGMSLAQIEAFLSSKGLFVKYVWIDGKFLSRLSPDAVVFALRKKGDDAHVFILRKRASDPTSIQCVDTIMGVEMRLASDVANEGLFGLVASKNIENLPGTNEFIPPAMLPLIFISAGMVFVAWNFFRSNKHEK